jgi:archaemetzincin
MIGRLQILPLGNVDPELLEWLCYELEKGFRTDTEVLSPMDPSFAYHPERKQYHSTEILEATSKRVTRSTWRMLAVTEVDLYVPILTFVFGEAMLGGRNALVSYHRLRQEFYGLGKDRDVLARRLLTEAVHELGHTMHLIHCADHRCVMSSSHAVEWIDIKESTFCSDCAERALVVA